MLDVIIEVLLVDVSGSIYVLVDVDPLYNINYNNKNLWLVSMKFNVNLMS